MKVLYTRVSSVDQKTDRQRINEKDFDLVIEDKCSGSIRFKWLVNFFIGMDDR
jgi:DNA invertase Pin-like site-specific DNA recombinase